MSRHYYSDTAVTTQLVAGISSTATSLTVGSTSGFPASFPYYLVLDQETASMEVVEVTAAAGSVLTVVRGQSGTTGVTHTSGAAVKHVAPAAFYNTQSQHESSNSSVHGVTTVVGTAEVQTLTNKTISGAANTITSIAKSSVTGAPTGAFVGDTDTQTLTNKTISGAANTLSNIPTTALTGGPSSALVGVSDTQTLTNKTISGASNTLSNIPKTAITGAPAGTLVGTSDTQTLTNKAIDGNTNTFTNLPTAALTGNINPARLTSVPAASLTGAVAAARLTSFEGGHTTITPVANTPTSVTVTGLNVAGTNFFGLATANTTVPGSFVLGTSVTNVSSSGLTLWIYRTSATATTVEWLVIGQ